MNEELKARLDREISENPVVLFMKGSQLMPQCGFSAAALSRLKLHGPVHTVNVLKEPEVREGIKVYSSWPTLPQVYINGKFVGGSDIVIELEERGELGQLIKGS